MEANTGCEPIRERNIRSSYVHSRQTMVTAITEVHRATRAQGKERCSGRGIYML